ncbi:MAG: hypothetical protein LBM27_06105, partial [Lactobacillaceae bacterium]|nr:hypothetical protein [Lactobacillaceae bacterium]
ALLLDIQPISTSQELLRFGRQRFNHCLSCSRPIGVYCKSITDKNWIRRTYTFNISESGTGLASVNIFNLVIP